MKRCLTYAAYAAMAVAMWAIVGLVGIAEGCDDDITRSFKSACRVVMGVWKV